MPSSFSRDVPISFCDLPVLRNFTSTVTQHLRALELLGLPVEHWYTVLSSQLASKLDQVTSKEWEDFPS
ncbi:hypothetical protein HUJ05_005211 [Dendroctonus ponderosae]|nr:hypothetical protein HUJ05_005211 [Dendroctonus ponderosae]